MTNSPAILHLLDHQGTIRRLIEPLCELPGHIVLKSYHRMDMDPVARVAAALRQCGGDVTVVLHATEWHLPFRLAWDEIAALTSSSAVFMHVTPSYLHQLGHEADLAALSHYTSADERRAVLVPSGVVAGLYRDHGVRAVAVQIGIDPPTGVAPRNHLAFAAVSSCTLADPWYSDLKGIPEFVATVRRLNLTHRAAILGHDGPVLGGVRKLALRHESMLTALAHTRAYVQLSKSEAYNVTAIEAKMLRRPVIVTAIEGHVDNVRFGITVDNVDEVVAALAWAQWDRQLPRDVARAVDRNCEDAQDRETLLSFHRSLTRVINTIKLGKDHSLS